MAKYNIDKAALNDIALSIRTLSMDAIQKAKSGHPGLPLGCAEIGAMIYGWFLKYHTGDVSWVNRDRFVLSAGHGSMLLYSLLHLAGFGVTLEDVKNFRQLESRTPGHPEVGMTPGVETTTGPLGQGISNAVGLAMAEKLLAARFNTKKHKVVDHFTYAIVGDGDLMEGISYEAASLAGHLGLGKLIVFYDSNRITIEGSTDLAFTEDVVKRFDAAEWHVQECDAYDADTIAAYVEKAQAESGRPSLIKLNSQIAKGAATMVGSHEAHGSPLGDEEIAQTRKNLGVEGDFYVAPGALKFFKETAGARKEAYDEWQVLFKEWGAENPELLDKWKTYFAENPQYKIDFNGFKVGDKVATRSASGKVLNAIAGMVDNLIGGSADLSPSNKSDISGVGSFQKESPLGRNLHFGIREHAMGGILNGLALHGGIRPYGATFLVFADYMRPSIRLASLMELPVIYPFTHDSIFVGEDGPTHQPIEHMASLRIIPGVTDFRPGDAEETVAAWEVALNNVKGPTVMALTRQNLEVYKKADSQWRETIKSGAYIVKEAEGDLEKVIVATGSEVSLVLKACEQLDSKNIRVVSMPSVNLFKRQDEAFRKKLIPDGPKKLVVEMGISFGWEFITSNVISINRFGASGPGPQVAEMLGFGVSHIVEAIKNL